MGEVRKLKLIGNEAMIVYSYCSWIAPAIKGRIDSTFLPFLSKNKK